MVINRKAPLFSARLGRSIAIWGILAIIFAGIPGCSAVVGAGAWIYDKGSTEAYYAASYDRTWNATVTAIKKSHFRTLTVRKDATKGVIEIETPQGRKGTITVKPSDPGVTLVEMRFGTWGEKRTSEAFERRIRDNLGKT